MSPAVVFLPDTALLVPGAAGLADPAADLRAAALVALRAATPGPGGRVLVVAPGRRDRNLPHPVACGLGAAGLPDPAAGARVPGAVADVAASTALALLHLAGVIAPVDVVETARPAGSAPLDLAPDVAVLVLVGSTSARHGPDAPLADDPRAVDVDARLVDALASGPAALAVVLDDLGPETAGALAVSGWAPWRAALPALLGPGAEPLRAAACTDAVVAGAQHVVALWLPQDPPADPARPAATSPEESR